MTKLTQYPVKTIAVDAICEKCNQDYYRPTGVMQMSEPPKFSHRCNKCGDIKFFSEKYPTIRYVREGDSLSLVDFVETGGAAAAFVPNQVSRHATSTRVVNCTPHSINFFSQDDTLVSQTGRKLIIKSGAKPYHVIEPSGISLWARKENLPNPEIMGAAIPLRGAVTFNEVEPVPEEFDDAAIIIVSTMYRTAVRDLGGDTSRLAIVDSVVYESADNLKAVGCIALAVG